MAKVFILQLNLLSVLPIHNQMQAISGTCSWVKFPILEVDYLRMNVSFLARVLVGKTTTGNQATRVCPEGFDTTGGGTVFVTYHDAQAYGEYLIAFR